MPSNSNTNSDSTPSRPKPEVTLFENASFIDFEDGPPAIVINNVSGDQYIEPNSDNSSSVNSGRVYYRHTNGGRTTTYERTCGDGDVDRGRYTSTGPNYNANSNPNASRNPFRNPRLQAMPGYTYTPDPEFAYGPSYAPRDDYPRPHAYAHHVPGGIPGNGARPGFQHGDSGSDQHHYHDAHNSTSSSYSSTGGTPGSGPGPGPGSDAHGWNGTGTTRTTTTTSRPMTEREREAFTRGMNEMNRGFEQMSRDMSRMGSEMGQMGQVGWDMGRNMSRIGEDIGRNMEQMGRRMEREFNSDFGPGAGRYERRENWD